jgi:adenylyltransferase/sulfurtransferase
MTQPERCLSAEPNMDYYLICRLGNDSQIAAQALRGVDGDRVIKDVIGGLRAWSNQVDPKFPVY